MTSFSAQNYKSSMCLPKTSQSSLAGSLGSASQIVIKRMIVWQYDLFEKLKILELVGCDFQRWII